MKLAQVRNRIRHSRLCRWGGPASALVNKLEIPPEVVKERRLDAMVKVLPSLRLFR